MAAPADRALSENSRLSNRWKRVADGGSLWASDETTSRSRRRSPVFGGIGPIAWRQAINAVRNSGRVVLVFFGIAALTGPLITNSGLPPTNSAILGGLYFFVAFILPRTLACDFRGELSRMEHYKALPIAPWRICAGQLVMPVLISSSVQLVMIFSLLPFLDFTSAAILLAMAVYTLPFNMLLYGVENLVFLLFPSKLVPVGRVDFDFIGRNLVEFVLKTFIVFTVIAIARSVGIAAQRFTGEFFFTFGITSWLMLTYCAAMFIPMMAWAFRRFNVSDAIE